MTTPDTLELRRLAEAADPSLTSGKASLKVMTEFLRAGFEAQHPKPRRPSDPEKDAAFLLAAAAAVVPLLDRLEAAEGRAWRPIETAPMNERAILFAPASALYEKAHPDDWEMRVSRPRNWTWATHWMPLPPAPESGG